MQSDEPGHRVTLELREDQVEVLRALLRIQPAIPPAEFDALWRYAAQRDFTLEPELTGPLRRALDLLA